MEIFCRMCGVSSDQSIVIMRADLGDVLCQSCYEKRLDEWARSVKKGWEVKWESLRCSYDCSQITLRIDLANYTNRDTVRDQHRCINELRYICSMRRYGCNNINKFITWIRVRSYQRICYKIRVHVINIRP